MIIPCGKKRLDEDEYWRLRGNYNVYFKFELWLENLSKASCLCPEMDAGNLESCQELQ